MASAVSKTIIAARLAKRKQAQDSKKDARNAAAALAVETSNHSMNSDGAQGGGANLAATALAMSAVKAFSRGLSRSTNNAASEPANGKGSPSDTGDGTGKPGVLKRLQSKKGLYDSAVDEVQEGDRALAVPQRPMLANNSSLGSGARGLHRSESMGSVASRWALMEAATTLPSYCRSRHGVYGLGVCIRPAAP